MLTSLALTLIAITSGTLLTYTYDEKAPLASRLCSGACIGFAALGLVGFIFASLVGLNGLALALTTLILAGPFLLLDRYRRADLDADVKRASQAMSSAISHPDRWAIIYFLFYATVAICTWIIFSKAMVEKPEGISTGVLNNFGDLPFHLSVITRFAYGQNFPPEDPTYAGVRFTYPFITDFVSAMFVCAGASLRDSMFIENFIVGIALVGVLHRFGQQLLGNPTAAILVPVLIILNGGFGWLMVFQDASKADGGMLEVLTNIQHSYTILGDANEGWRWGNAVLTLLVPQRGFLLGIPLAVMVFGQWWLARQSSDEPSFRRMIAAGAIAGLLPLVHAHSFVVVVGMAGCLALINWRAWRDWATFFLVAFAIAGPQVLWSTHQSAVSTSSFIGIELGWDHGNENILWFWLKNTGLFIPLLISALIWKGDDYLVSRKLLLFYLPFTLCFIVPNIVRMAPWIWDNVKVLFYWWIASVPIIALLLARLWESNIWNRMMAASLFVVLTLAGGLDVFALVVGKADYAEFDRDGVAFAEQIKEQTPPRTMILHAPIHNTPIFLTGRRSLLGYPGHIWTHGLTYADREAEIKRIYAGAPDAADLLAKYSVDYVALGPTESSALKVNEAFFSRYRKVIEVGGYGLYKIPP